MKVVVSGAKGFIGSKLLSSLNGKYDFVALDVEDFSEPSTIEKSFDKANVLVHLAGISSIAECDRDVYNAYKVNVALTGFLTDTFYRVNPTGRVIFASTGQLYSSQERLPLTIASAVRPSNTYTRTKQCAEDVIRDLAIAYNGKFTILRFFNIAHKSQRPVFFLPSVYNQLQNSSNDKVILDVGNINVERDFSSIQDIIRVIDYCLKNSGSYLAPLENVCSGVPKNLRAVVIALAKKLNKNVEFRVDLERVREGEVESHFGTSRFVSLGLMPDGQSIDKFIDAFLND